MGERHNQLTEGEVLSLLRKHFDDVRDIIVVEDGYSTAVWRFVSDKAVYYLRVLCEIDELVFAEALVLEEAKRNGCCVPYVIVADDSKKIIDYSYIVISEIQGKPLDFKMEKIQRDAVLRDAGIELARFNSIKAKRYGYCDHALTRENGVITGVYDDATAMIRCKVRKGLAIFLERELITQAQSNRVAEYALTKIEHLAGGHAKVVHGDYDRPHIFQSAGRYTGLIDFGDVRSGDMVYDLAHFAIYNPDYIEPLFTGWLEEFQQLCPEVSMSYAELKGRVAYHQMVIALDKGAWVVEHGLAYDVYVDVLKSIAA